MRDCKVLRLTGECHDNYWCLMLVIGGVRVEMDECGIMRLPKKAPQAEKLMDTMYQKLGANKWACRSAIWTKYANKFEGQIAHIFGKGPSLDQLETFPGIEPMIGVNHAALVIEQLNPHNPNLFCVMRDKACGFFMVKNVELLIPPTMALMWSTYDYKTFVRPKEVFGIVSGISAKLAIGVAKLFGCREAHLWGFDVCVSGQEGYATKVKQKWKKGPGRYESHRGILERQAAEIDLPIRWRMPDGTNQPSTYKLLKRAIAPRG